MQRRLSIAAAVVAAASLAGAAGVALASPTKGSPPKKAAGGKVSVCHRTADGFHTIGVNKRAVPAQVRGGAFVAPSTGGCPELGQSGATLAHIPFAGGVFNGVFTVDHFAMEDGKLVAVGRLVGTA